MASKVAVVTGANKGIGFAIARALCKEYKGDVILTARDFGRGQRAIDDLQKEGLNPKFHRLDIQNIQSINQLKTFLLSNYGGLDVLVNNAGVAHRQADPAAPMAEQALVNFSTNFWGTMNVFDVLLPIVNSGGRVSSLSSTIGSMTLAKCTKEKKSEILALQSLDALKSLSNEFVHAAKDDTLEKFGYPKSAVHMLGASKMVVTAMTILQQALIDKDSSRSDILINCCCPGNVKTDMTGHQGNLTIDQGAVTPVYLALLPPDTQSPKGNLVRDKKVLKWR